jgi:beta-mannosidase
MLGQVRRIDGHPREPLRTGWSLCAVPPGGDDVQTPPADSDWLAITTLAPAAAALRELGRWSLDQPPRRFDAEDWWYRLRFDAPVAAAGEKLFLGFDGLATIAQVWLNGQPLLSSDNMFVAHEREVGAALKPNDNELLLRFRALDSWLAKRRPRPRWRTPMIENQQLRWARTTLLGRTPGWSPPAAVVGPWQDIWLERRSGPALHDLQLRSELDRGKGIVRVELDGDSVEGAELVLSRGSFSARQALSRRDGRLHGELKVDAPVLWWPHTHGEPALYEAALQLKGGGKVSLGAIGFRNITVDRENGDFALRVNGVPVFCRGACWTPLDAVSLRATPEALSNAVAQARGLGMNMLRVPGTGVYEDDAFFDACDAQGMLVWQDLMFANMDYPVDDAAFSAGALAEVGQQLARWRARPSLAVLCGNSEVEQQAAMWGAARGLWSSPWFDEVLARVCEKEIPSLVYWPSSAHGGAFPHQASVGTTSYYGVGAYLRPLDDARRVELRFATECLAFANVPQPSAAARLPGAHATRVHHAAWKSRSPRDLGAGWDFDDVRDHYLGVLFGVDPPKLRYADHERYLLLSRITTAEVMAATFAEWRRPASTCRGAMVLMLRDLWAGAGWGLIDDAGVPKASAHGLRRVLQPTAVFLSDEGVNGLSVDVVHERGEALGAELELSVWRNGDVRVATGRAALALAPHSGTTRPVLELFEHFTDLSYAYRFGPLAHDAVVATLTGADGTRLGQAFHFPAGFGLQREADVGLTAQARMTDGGDAELLVGTKRLAQSVYFDIPGFEALDEYFHLVPGEDRRIVLRRIAGHAGLPSGTVHALNSSAACRLGVST